MLPGFIPRLHAELLRALAPPTAAPRPTRSGRPPLPQYDRYASLRPLLPYLAILNNPSPPPPLSDRARANAGKAPAFTPATLAWVGGSLAGYVVTFFIFSLCAEIVHRALKTGGVEVVREKWDEVNAHHDPDESMDMSEFEDRRARNILPDWTSSPLPMGAPSANMNTRMATQTEVGA